MTGLLFAMLILVHAENGGNCPPEIHLPGFNYACEQAADCAIAGDSCRACNNPFAINKKFLKEFDERDQILRGRYECSVDCEPCNVKEIKVYCVEKRCTLDAPPEPTVTRKRSKKRIPASESPPIDAAAAEKTPAI